MKHAILALAVSIVPGMLFAQEKVELTESYFKKIDPSLTPQMQKIELNYLNTKSQMESLKDKYNYYLTGSASSSKSNEQAFIAQIPVTSSASSYTLGVAKDTTYGVSVSTNYNVNKYTNNYLTDASTATVTIGLEVDLLKNFMGRTAKNEYEAAETNVQEMKIMRDIQKKQFINELRKSYWDLVSTEEAFKVSKRLLASAQRQLDEQKQKLRSGLGTKGDVSRFQSLVNDRKNSLIQLEATRSQKIQLLKQQIPQLVGKEVVIGSYNLDQTVTNFFQCTALIEKQSKTPMDFTLYDEVLDLKSKRLALSTKSLENYASPDLKLVTEYDLIGNDFSTSDAQSELSDGNQVGYTVGLEFSMPIGSTNKNTEKIQIAAKKAQIDSEKLEIDSRLHTLHKGIVDNLNLLEKIILNRVENQRHVDTTLKDSQRKYRQARITSRNLIDDEDQKLNNDLGLIQVQSDIIQIMLDYFSVFTETPCELNKI